MFPGTLPSSGPIAAPIGLFAAGDKAGRLIGAIESND
jgi:hypothetical protein